MNKAKTKPTSPAPLPQIQSAQIEETKPQIELLVLDNNIPFHGSLINKFSSSEYSIEETEKGGNTWFSIHNDRVTLFVPIHRISYIVYKSVKA
jgi:uncharacterized protein (UPF0248 family)